MSLTWLADADIMKKIARYYFVHIFDAKCVLFELTSQPPIIISVLKILKKMAVIR